ncbi:unnamed protein product, partial [Staurois parvus]
AGIGSPGIRSLARPRAPRHLQGSGLRVNRHDSGHRGHQVPGLSGSTAGIGSPGMTAGTGITRHQVILACQRAPRHLARQWAPGHQALDRLVRQRASGHQASGHLARQRAPRHLARQWAPSHQVRQRALSQLARQRAPDQVPDHLDQQRASSQL